MLFSVPFSKGVTVTDTPINVKSIRSFYFVNRSKGLIFTEKKGFDCFVTIMVNGQTICENLFIMPFLDYQTEEMIENSAPFDYRNIDIPCLLNVDLSEIKIFAPNCSDLEFSVVFNCSESEVEQQKVLWFENKIISEQQLAASKESGRFSDILAGDGEEAYIKIRYESDGFFVLSCRLIQGFAGSDEGMFRIEYNELDEQVISFFDTNEKIPNESDLVLFSPTNKIVWKKVRYWFNMPICKDCVFIFKRKTFQSYQQGAFRVLYLIHEKKI